MEVVFFKDVLLKLICKDFDNRFERHMVEKIFGNPHSRILISRNLLTHLESLVPEAYRHDFESFVTAVADNAMGNIYNPPRKDSPDTFEDEFKALLDQAPSDVVIGISYKSQNLGPDHSKRVAAVSLAKKPTRHWLLASLAANHPDPVTISSLDFEKPKDVENFFANAFAITRRTELARVFDRFVNLTHQRLDELKNFKNIQFFTFHNQKEPDDLKRKIESIKKKFPSAQIYIVKNDVFFLHGRNIVIGNLVIYADNDFGNLSPGPHQDWRIGVSLSDEESKRFAHSVNKFSLIRN
jgi:hypothetical protein